MKYPGDYKQITTTLTMLLFVIGLTMNVLFCGTCNLYGLSDRITAAETWATVAKSWTSPENIEASGDAVNAPAFKSPLLDKDSPHTENVTKNICPIPVMAAILKGFHLPLISSIPLLHFLSASFIALPDKPTLINQKIRLDN